MQWALDNILAIAHGRTHPGWGYVSLVMDSFTTRGIKESCDMVPAARQGDALGALAYLSKLPFVDPSRIAVMGSSQAASSRWS